MNISFEHYLIRHLEQGDVQRYYALISNNRKRLEDFFAGTVSKTKTLPDTERFLSEVQKKREEKTYFPYVVINLNDQHIIGFIDVKNIDWVTPKAELGCFIDEKYAGKGVSGKAMKQILPHLFEEYGFNKLFLRTHQSNAAARSLAEKCGFEVEGVLRNDYKTTEGKLVDLIYYGLLREIR